LNCHYFFVTKKPVVQSFEDLGESVYILRAQTEALDIGGVTEDFKAELKRERVLKFEIEGP